MRAWDRKELCVCFCCFLGGHMRYFLSICRLPISTSHRKSCFPLEKSFIPACSSAHSLYSHCQKGLRTYYPLYIQWSQDVDWPLTFSKEFPHMFALQKFLRMWLFCVVFTMGSLPYFLVTDWDQVRKMLVFQQVSVNTFACLLALVISYIILTWAFKLESVWHTFSRLNSPCIARASTLSDRNIRGRTNPLSSLCLCCHECTSSGCSM